MSHVATIDLEIDDLTSLQAAAEALGLTFSEKKTYKWYGRSVGDYPLPNGFTEADLGKCDYAISLPGNSKAYEVGVVRNKNGKGYQLLWDFWNVGFGLEEKIGKNAGLLKQSYAVSRAKKEMLRQGYRASTRKDAKGNVILTFTE